ncbi:MAG TPA: lasso peptide biosynthesis B2 protein [Sporichthya sp.]|nr:lasso peptide biosynthesis B2 protein [Sporichthya sp.]
MRSPADAVLTARMVGWALVLPVLKAVLPLRRLVRLMALSAPATPRNPDAEHAIANLARIAHRVVGLGRRDNCLERSLIAYRYLGAANASPLLVVGARNDQHTIEGHVWLTVDGVPVHDEAAALSRFTPVTAFDASGAPVPSAPTGP